MAGEIIRHTFSVCPVCLKRLPAQHLRIGKEIFLQKKCPDHGEFKTIIWRGNIDIDLWRSNLPEISENENLLCPAGCGLCGDHRQDTCCTIFEVTKKCNLRCAYCFAGEGTEEDKSLDEIKNNLFGLTVPGKTLLQLSGGEPTLRDDLPDIVAAAKEYGCKYVQLNSNGLRLAADENYLEKLAGANLSFVFMQFDGTNDSIYEQLRKKPVLNQKLKAIENCAKYNLGVTLVATLVPGVNTDNIGELIRFAISMSPAVRGIHFQPVSYFGRYPAPPDDSMRLTIDQLIAEIEKQTDGLVGREQLAPSRCDHALCGFHGDFIVMPEGLKALTKFKEDDGCCKVSASQNREFVGRRWQREKDCCCGGDDVHTFDGFLNRIKSHGFTITCMAFQDCYNLDIERLRQCSSHVYKGGRLIPLCANYLSSECGE
jgi:uncharacterized radical SAM superfamily Fe-S cluster-containing enzyme